MITMIRIHVHCIRSKKCNPRYRISEIDREAASINTRGTKRGRGRGKGRGKTSV
jgi:hypothetical protein